MSKISLNELILKLTPNQQRVAQKIIQTFEKDFWKIPGSRAKHQAWEGGYVSHLEEAMNIASILLRALKDVRPLPFTESDALFMLFLHDCDKLFRYSSSTPLPHDDAQDLFLETLKETWGYQLTPEEKNALMYVHGEGSDYNEVQRVMLPLAAFIHCCDIISARIWFDFGREHQSWNA